MSDLIRRLRDSSYGRRHPLPVSDLDVWHKTCCEAADEIERLRAIILEAIIGRRDGDGLADAVRLLVEERAEAQNRRAELREEWNEIWDIIRAGHICYDDRPLPAKVKIAVDSCNKHAATIAKAAAREGE